MIAELRNKFSLVGGVHRTMSICWFGYHYTAPHTDLIWNCISMAPQLLGEEVHVHNRIHPTHLCVTHWMGKQKTWSIQVFATYLLFVCLLSCTLQHIAYLWNGAKNTQVQLKKTRNFLQTINYLLGHCTRLPIAGTSGLNEKFEVKILCHFKDCFLGGVRFTWCMYI